MYSFPLASAGGRRETPGPCVCECVGGWGAEKTTLPDALRMLLQPRLIGGLIPINLDLCVLELRLNGAPLDRPITKSLSAVVVYYAG
jgi:hypothetical protein